MLTPNATNFAKLIAEPSSKADWKRELPCAVQDGLTVCLLLYEVSISSDSDHRFRYCINDPDADPHYIELGDYHENGVHIIGSKVDFQIGTAQRADLMPQIGDYYWLTFAFVSGDNSREARASRRTWLRDTERKPVSFRPPLESASIERGLRLKKPSPVRLLDLVTRLLENVSQGKQSGDMCPMFPPAVVQRYFDTEEDEERYPGVERPLNAIRVCSSLDHNSIPWYDCVNGCICSVAGNIWRANRAPRTPRQSSNAKVDLPCLASSESPRADGRVSLTSEAAAM
ncbi:hypothetical protein HPB52_015435 [Rhipicephalus sanguineus]|uniref:Uncharacterized protein n=1 Tax=Rhipicephalus sanguineus TaxID=34632 RepID=A0A9D4QDF7_RHISA|nr:hypothetical protein HPB52_015435 [Rhipicephalus sanguineus]